ncbi:exosome complex exonuclease RRP6 [Nematocida sp. LUAm3]|nr:exosome complex exonuclease RRP6 [Nematocida sp. LUAm3]KAI5174568.1 exosome complex exonuclease RRP6 [Nematocida sp. LUAm2]KAI5178026.1 exosome complex exonuclease RRP6 [Nematocida sp. LUAm1]
MDLSHVAFGVVKSLEKSKLLIEQEKLLLSEEALGSKREKILLIVEEIRDLLDISELEILKKSEDAMDELHRKCIMDERQSMNMNIIPKSIKISCFEKNFILSQNIPRPQVDFKDRGSKYALTTARGMGAFLHCGFGEEQIFHLHSEILRYFEKFERNVVFVESAEDMRRANERILGSSIVGMDVKMHRFRSYNGFMCFLLVDTFEETYIFDMVSLRNFSGELSFLGDKKVFKIMYKMCKKRYLIEKDLKCIVESAVDLNSISDFVLPNLSYYQMANKYLSIGIKKQFHLVDWRHRPITQEMCVQMKQDVQHILKVFSVVSGKLSIEQFMKIYREPVEYVIKEKSPEFFSNTYSIPVSQQLTDLFTLREFLAKQEDESPAFIMTDRQMCILLKNMPSTPQEVFSLLPAVSPLFKANLNNFLRVLHPENKSKSFSMQMLTSSEKQ